MTNSERIQEALCEEVLKQELEDEASRDQQEKLRALKAALAESTSLDERNISAIANNLEEEEASKASGKQLKALVKLPAINTQYIRIAAYLMLGLIGFSVYKSAQVNTLQIEQSYQYTEGSKVDLQISVSTLRSFLVTPFNRYYNEFEAFPSNVQNLDAVSKASDLLRPNELFSSADLLENGTVRLTLSENYGYNRWIELIPTVIAGSSRRNIEFKCRSNAEEHLLHNNGSYWCNAG